jgi:hypothetical protein
VKNSKEAGMAAIKLALTVMTVRLSLAGAGGAPAAGLPPQPAADIIRCATPPRVDGDLSDPCWAQATLLSAPRKLGSGEESDSGRIRLCADDQWLYAALRAVSDGMVKTSVKVFLY